MPVENLCFGFYLQAAQLLFEAGHRTCELRQIEVDGVDLLIEAGAENAHLSRVVEHGVEQIGVDARHFHSFGRRALAPRQYRSAAQLETRNGILACSDRSRLERDCRLV